MFTGLFIGAVLGYFGHKYKNEIMDFIGRQLHPISYNYLIGFTYQRREYAEFVQKC